MTVNAMQPTRERHTEQLLGAKRKMRAVQGVRNGRCGRPIFRRQRIELTQQRLDVATAGDVAFGDLHV